MKTTTTSCWSEATPSSQRAGVTIAVLMPHAPVLVPSVGGERLGEVAGTVRAIREVSRRVVAAQPDSLVAVSPHSPRRPGAFGIWAGRTLHGSLEQFGASDAEIDLPIDNKLADSIAAKAHSCGLATWEIRNESLDHGAIVPLWFLSEAGWCGPTVLLSLNSSGEGGLGELGNSIAAAAKKTVRCVAFLASGDMSHCLKPGAPAGFHSRGSEFDREFIRFVERGNYRALPGIDPGLSELAAEDVLDSTLIATAATDLDPAGHELLSYEAPFGVGYGVAVLFAAASRDYLQR